MRNMLWWQWLVILALILLNLSVIILGLFILFGWWPG